MELDSGEKCFIYTLMGLGLFLGFLNLICFVAQPDLKEKISDLKMRIIVLETKMKIYHEVDDHGTD